MAKKKVDVEEPVITSTHRNEEADVTVERRLIALYRLQQIDSQIDRIRIVRGELPLEVQDLEDDIAGLETRIDKYNNEASSFETLIAEKKKMIEECNSMIAKYAEQQNNVRNNREYDSLSKEIEFQNLEIQLCEKKIKEATYSLENHKEKIESFREVLDERKKDLEAKRLELEEIVKETEEREKILLKESKENETLIDERYLTAYKRIRGNARNGLAVVEVDRDACGGCFNKIPHQRQMDIRMHKKIIVCEYCGRILVDQTIAAEVQNG